MKKMLTLVCSIALCMGVNAQVKAPLAKEKPASVKMEAVASPISVAAPKGAAIKAAVWDTVPAQVVANVAAQLGGTFYMSYSCTGVPRKPGSNDADWDKYFTGDAIWFTMGSGWMSHKYGSGEVGYSYDFTDRGWFSTYMDMVMNEKSIVGAIVMMGRAKSKVDKMNSKAMPLKFKVYGSWQVANQKAYTDITSNAGCDETVSVYYPADPEKYAFYSETVEVPIVEPKPNSAGETPRFAYGYYGARFPQPVAAGHHPCLSVIFPTERNDEDTLWNACLYGIGDGSDASVTSEQPASMYVVYDFNYQSIWGQEEGNDFIYTRGERGNWMLADSLKQPNMRYAVLPLLSWNWLDANYNSTSRMDDETNLMVIVSDEVAIERGAAYDKYVEVKNNPAVGYTKIASPDQIQRVDIYNMNGKLMKSQKCNSQIETIDLKGLNSGMYVAKVTTAAGVANKKLMVR